MRFNELMTGARQDVVCKIYGEDLDSLAVYANKLGSVISIVEKAEDLYIEPIMGAPQIIITYNGPTPARYQISIKDTDRIINMAFVGQQSGLVFEGERRFELIVRLENERRAQLEDVRILLICTHSGKADPNS